MAGGREAPMAVLPLIDLRPRPTARSRRTSAGRRAHASPKPPRWRATVPAYAETMAQRSDTTSGALAWAALGLLAKPCSVLELTRRFEREGAVIEPARAAELLEEL